MTEVSYLAAMVLGIVEGLTEYLPVSSTGHLTVTEKLLGLPIDDPAITGYTAVIQFGAVVATFVYFRADILRFAGAWLRGLRDTAYRSHPDYRAAWVVIVGSLPVILAALLFKDLIKGGLRSLWVVAAALVLWSIVMWIAEVGEKYWTSTGKQRGELELTLKDGLVIGCMQCMSLIPGVSRSGATISAGLMAGIDRVTATRLSFFMAIPALTAAGLYELKDVDTTVVPLGPMILGMVVSFVVAYGSIKWLLGFVATNTLRPFIAYRVVAGLLLMVLLGTGLLTPR